MEEIKLLQEILSGDMSAPLTISGIILGLLMMAKRIWRGLSEEMVNTKTDNASITVINTMVSDIERLNKTISQMSEAQQRDRVNIIKERDELNTRIKELEDEVNKIKEEHYIMKEKALEIYHYVMNTQETLLDHVKLRTMLYELVSNTREDLNN